MELGALEIIYSMQSALLAVLVVPCTNGIKMIVDLAMGGSAVRKKNPWVDKVVMPGVPVALGIVGALICTAVGFVPEALAASVEGASAWVAGPLWGAACGQFGTYVFDRINGSLLKWKNEQ